MKEHAAQDVGLCGAREKRLSEDGNRTPSGRVAAPLEYFDLDWRFLVLRVCLRQELF